MKTTGAAALAMFLAMGNVVMAQTTPTTPPSKSQGTIVPDKTENAPPPSSPKSNANPAANPKGEGPSGPSATGAGQK